MSKCKPFLEVSRYRYQVFLTASSKFWCLEFHCNFQHYLKGYLYSVKEEHMWSRVLFLRVGFVTMLDVPSQKYQAGYSSEYICTALSDLRKHWFIRFSWHFFSYFISLRCSDWSEDRYLCDQFWPCVRHWHGKYISWNRKRKKNSSTSENSHFP